jgi:hypothetical protein
MTWQYCASLCYQLYVETVGKNHDYLRVAGDKNTVTFTKDPHSHMQMHLNENTPRKSFYIFRQQSYLPHF